MTHPRPVGAAPVKPLRSDAQRNRAAILDAARDAFASDGLETSLEGIAARAGLAIGTLYRHFPTRLDLAEALFTEKMSQWLTAAEEALAIPDAWAGFAYYLTSLCELQAHDRGFNDFASMRFPTRVLTEDARVRAFRMSREIVRRAQQSGDVRADVTPEDMAFVLWAQARVIQATRSVAPDAWRRHLGLMLDAFRAEGAHPLPGPPMTPREVEKAMTNMGDSGACGG